MSNIEKWTTHKINLDILTPVIINSGEIYEYGELLFLSNRLYKLNLMNLIKRMSTIDRNQYIDLVSKGISTHDVKYHRDAKKIIEKTIANNKDKQREFFSRPMSYLSSVEDIFDNKPYQEIEKSVVRKINDKPYIPGSSIKGAIRTAIIQSLLTNNSIKESDYIENYHGRNQYIKTKDFEFNLLNIKKGVTNDPFKYIKVSDFEFIDPRINSFVGEVKIKTKGNPLNVYTTMSDAYCLKNNKITLRGTISISSKLLNIYSMKEFLSFERILDSLNEFYIENYNQKRDKFPIKVQEDMRDLINDNLLENNSALIKLGRFSGIENITYNIIQDMRINRKIKNENINIEGGSSFALIGNKYLPGYCIISEDL